MSSKKTYVPPAVTIEKIFIEQALAAGSEISLRINEETGMFDSQWENESLTSEFEW